MSSVRGNHIPGASSGAVDEARKPKMAKEPVKKGGKDSGKKPFPGAAPPFKKGGKRK